MGLHVLMLCLLTIGAMKTEAPRSSGQYYDLAVEQFFGSLPRGTVLEIIADGREMEHNVEVVEECLLFMRKYMLPNETIFEQIKSLWNLENSFFDVDLDFYFATIENSPIGQQPNASNICHIFLLTPLPGWMNHQLRWMGRENLKTMNDLLSSKDYEGMSRLVYSNLVELKKEDKEAFDRASRKIGTLCSDAYKYSLNETNFEKFEKARKLEFENAAFEFLEEVRNDLLARNDNTRVAIQVCRLLHQMNPPLERNSTPEGFLLCEIAEYVQKDQQAKKFMSQQTESTYPVDLGNYTRILVEYLESTNSTETYSLAKGIFNYLVEIVRKTVEQTEYSCITNDNVWVEMLQKISTNESCHAISSIPTLQIAVDKTLNKKIKMIKNLLVVCFKVVCENMYNFVVDPNRLHIGNYYHELGYRLPTKHWSTFNLTKFESVLNRYDISDSLFT